MTSEKHRKTDTCRLWLAAVSAVMLVQGAWAQPSETEGVAARYPSGSIQSVESAERALADVGKERAEVEQHFAAEKNACLSRFFVSSCEDNAKERRRMALERLKAVEVEANAYKRRERVVERDRALEEKRVKDEQDFQERMRQQAENPRQPRTPDKLQRSAADAARAEGNASERQARHQEKLKRIEADEAANAQKRAENISAYQKKVQAAQAHQKDVERRKAEKERERAQRPAAPSTQ